MNVTFNDHPDFSVDLDGLNESVVDATFDDRNQTSSAGKFDSLIPVENGKFPIVSVTVQAKSGRRTLLSLSGGSVWLCAKDGIVLEDRSGSPVCKVDLKKHQLKVEQERTTLRLKLTPESGDSVEIAATLTSELDVQNLAQGLAELGVESTSKTDESKAKIALDFLDASTHSGRKSFQKSLNHYIRSKNSNRRPARDKFILPLPPDVAKEVDRLLENNRLEIDAYKAVLKETHCYKYK